MKTVINFLSWILGVSFNALIFIALAIAVYQVAQWGFEQGDSLSDVLTAERGNETVVFVLEDVTPVAQVAQLLEEAGIVQHAMLYQAEMWLVGGGRADYEPGTFRLNPNMSGTRINHTLRSPPSDDVELGDQVRIRMREGWTVRDFAIYLEERGFFTAEQFLYAAEYADFGFAFVHDIPTRPPLVAGGRRPSRLEGYLFPDTYFFNPNPTPTEIIDRMLRQFNEVFDFTWRMQAEEMGRTVDEIVIIASMIEREVRYPPERPMVSRVIYNRLRTGMQLQIDATVAYALDIHLARTYGEALRVVSPYSTYHVAGLPAGPIGAPGRASLYAALNPVDGPWLFYVLVNAETGAHAFTETYDQHQYYVRNHMPRPWLD